VEVASALALGEGNRGLEVTLVHPLCRVEIAFFPTEDPRRRWLSGGLLAVSFRMLEDGASPLASPPHAEVLADVERAVRLVDAPGTSDPRAVTLREAIEKGSIAPDLRRRRAGEGGSWRALVSHYYEGLCPAPEEAVVRAALDLGFVDAFVRGARSAGELAAELGCDPRGTELVVRALASMGVIEGEESGRFRLSADAARVLGHPRDAVLWRREEEALWAGLAARLKTGTSHFPHVMSSGKAEQWLRAIGQMQQGNLAAHVRDLDLGDATAVLDVGSGGGRYAEEMLRQHDRVHVTLVDYPQSIQAAERHLRDRGVVGRASFVAAEFFDPSWLPPAGHDVVWLSGVLHAVDEAAARSLLGALHAGLLEGGRIFVRESDSASPAVRQRLCELNYFLVGSGRGYRADELEAMLQSAGFLDVRTTPQGEVGVLLVGRKGRNVTKAP
jgi:SAM-dependent methyltransferase